MAEPLEGRLLATAAVSTVATFNAVTGNRPSNLVMDSAGNLFGTTEGSPGNYGTVFEIASGTHEVMTLATFDGANGSGPSSLTVDGTGNLYGTTVRGGDLNLNEGEGYGTVFEIPAGGRALRSLVAFDGTDGYYPENCVVDDKTGELFGTTTGIRANGQPSMFEVSPISESFSTLFDFGEGSIANGLAIGSSGDVYGVFSGSQGSVVFELFASVRILHNLAGVPQSDFPTSGPVCDEEGNLFLTGGSGVFELTAGAHALTAIASVHGLSPSSYGLITDSSGDQFGVTSGGGQGFGSLFTLTAGGIAVDTLAVLNGNDGSYPDTRLVADAMGNLYGATANENPDSGYEPVPTLAGGSVFEISGSGFVAAPSSPVVFSQPADQTTVANRGAIFTAVVGSTPAPSIQWQVSTDRGKTFADITSNRSAITQTLTLARVEATANGDEYRAVFTNDLGTVTSDAVKLSVVSILFTSPSHASPNLVTATSTVLTADGVAAVDAGRLSYRWAVVMSPPGSPQPRFSKNNSAAARQSIITFGKAGYYRVRCTISDGNGNSVASDVSVKVKQNATSLHVSPHNAQVPIGKSATIKALESDQFGHPMHTQPRASYYIVHGPGTINATTGQYTATAFGTVLIEAEEDSLTGDVGLQAIG